MSSISYREGSAEKVMASSGAVVKPREIPARWSQKITEHCAQVADPASFGRCMLEVARIINADDSFDIFPSTYILSSLRAVGTHRGVECEADLGLLAEFTEALERYDLGTTFRPVTCEDAATVFEGLTGSKPVYAICEGSDYSADYFSQCMARLWKQDIRGAARKMVHQVTNGGSPGAPFRFPLILLSEAAERGEREWGRTIIEVRAMGDECLAGPAPGLQRSYIPWWFASAQPNAGEAAEAERAKNAKAVTCEDYVTFLAEVGLVTKVELSTFRSIVTNGTVDLCSPARPSVTPVGAEVRKNTSDLAARTLCSADKFSFVVEGARSMVNFSVEGASCSMDAIGLPLSKVHFQFEPENCTNDAFGKASCTGSVQMYCFAADPARQALDCLGKNIEMDAVATYDYSAESCSWAAASFTEQPKTARPIKSMR